MSTWFPVLTLILLSVACSAYLRARYRSLWLCGAGGAVLASVAWIGAVYVLLFLTAPHEAEGPIVWRAVAYILLTALASSAAFCLVMKLWRRQAATGQA